MVWAKQYFEEVREAHLALTRYQSMCDVLREQMISIPSPAGSIGVEVIYHDDSRDSSMDKVDEYIDLTNQDAGMDWARDFLKEYDAFFVRESQSLSGDLALGLMCANMHYRFDISCRKIALALGMSKDTVRNKISALIDYYDYIGKEPTLTGTARVADTVNY